MGETNVCSSCISTHTVLTFDAFTTKTSASSNTFNRCLVTVDVYFKGVHVNFLAMIQASELLLHRIFSMIAYVPSVS